MDSATMDSTTIYDHVSSRYSATAHAPSNPSYNQAVAHAFGYSADELASIPAESNLGLSCGNPLALAGLKEGETVVDLGSGAGFDCFLAAGKVGKSGKVVGVDMNEDMLAKARHNAEKSALTNVTFLSSKISQIALPPATADVVISNCVINLVPDAAKPAVFAEAHRILKPGGRLAVSDILLKKDLPPQMKNDVALYVGCVAGASRKVQYEDWLREAGFGDVLVVDAGADLNVYTSADGGVTEGVGCCAPVKEKKSCCGGGKSEKSDGGVAQDMQTNFRDVDLNEWAGSYKIFAVKGAE